MVARYHYCAYARRLRLGDSRSGFGAGRVDYADESRKPLIAFDEGYIRGKHIDYFIRQRDDAQRVGGERVVHVRKGLHGVEVVTVEGQTVERALGQDEVTPSVYLVHGGHHFARRRKGNFGNLFIFCLKGAVIYPLVERQAHYRALGGVTEDAGRAVVVFPYRRRAGEAELFDEVDLVVIEGVGFGHGLTAAHPKALYGHLVHGQRTRLVGADYRGRTERFDSLHLADERVLCRHLFCALREYERDNERKRFGHRRHGERYGDHYHVHGQHAAALYEADDEEHYCRHYGDAAYYFAHLIEAHLQGRFLLLCIL